MLRRRHFNTRAAPRGSVPGKIGASAQEEEVFVGLTRTKAIKAGEQPHFARQVLIYYVDEQHFPTDVTLV